jgi:hypothetical protein
VFTDEQAVVTLFYPLANLKSNPYVITKAKSEYALITTWPAMLQTPHAFSFQENPSRKMMEVHPTKPQ